MQEIIIDNSKQRAIELRQSLKSLDACISYNEKLLEEDRLQRGKKVDELRQISSFLQEYAPFDSGDKTWDEFLGLNV